MAPPSFSLAGALARLTIRPSALPRALPALAIQTRSASILGNLSDVPSAYNKHIRRGRGPSSGKGKTSGRGHKGQKQHGSVPVGFNGGQTTDIEVSGERGFKNVFSVEMSPVNLGRIQAWIDAGRLDPTKPIGLKELLDSRAVHGIKDGVKLLGRDAQLLKTPINITVSRASKAAIAAIEAAGGTITTRYYTKQSIRMVTKPHLYKEGATNFEELGYKLPDASSRWDLEYYRDIKHRGYLSHLVPEGGNPSLFFSSMVVRDKGSEGEQKKKKQLEEKAAKAENRLF